MITDDTSPVFLPDRIEGKEGTQETWNAEASEGYQPIIGVPIPVQQGNQGPLLLADAVGAWAVERMHGRVLLIPLWPFPTHKYVYQSLWPLIHSIDGLFLPAGIQGTDWSLYESQPEPERWSISWEIALAQLATYLGMPLLAVADGAEKWNSALGGIRGEGFRKLSQAVPTTPETWDRHTIRVRAQSTLASYLQPVIAQQEGEQKPWELAFMPNQGVEKVAPGLRACAQFEDTVVAFERKDGAFGLGVVGRLDWGIDQAYGAALFDAFLHACRSFDHTRQHHAAWEASRDTICATVSERVTQSQSLISVPVALPEERRPPLSGSLISPISSKEATGPQEHSRQRSPQPTKEALNRMRRQRLKLAIR